MGGWMSKRSGHAPMLPWRRWKRNECYMSFGSQAFQCTLNWISPFFQSVVIEVSYPALKTQSLHRTVPGGSKVFLPSRLHLLCCSLLISCEAVPSVEMVNIILPVIFSHGSDITDCIPLMCLHITLKRLRSTPDIVRGSDYTHNTSVSSERLKVLPVFVGHSQTY